MTDNLRQRFLAASLREAQIENPPTMQAHLYNRVEKDGKIEKIPYTCLITNVDGIPYKVIRWDGNIATCQEITAQDLADLLEWHNKGAHS